MKLSEVIINNRKVKYDKSSPIGSRWLVVDESTDRVIEKHATKSNAFVSSGIPLAKKQIFEAATPPAAGVFPVGNIFELGPNKWGVGLGSADDIIEFTGDNARNGNQALAAARNFLENVNEADRTDANKLRRAAARTQGAVIRDISRLSQSLTRRAAQASATTFDALGNISRVGPTLRAALQNPWMRGLGRIGGATGLSFALVWTGIEIINDLENEAEDDTNLRDDNMELTNIVVGQISIQLMFLLLQVFRNASLFNRALRAIKWTVRAAQGAAFATVAGSIPSLVSLLVTESAWLIAGFIIASPTVQRSLAEWLHGNIMGVLIGGVGAGVVMAATALDAALDGQYGSGAFRRALGWERSDAAEAEEGEYTSSSEWAKLVFHGLLFPPGREQMLVPYIAPEQRASMLRQVMELDEQAAPAEPTADDTAPAEQPPATGEQPPATGETPAERSNRTREQSLRTDYSNPNYTRAQPTTGPR